MKAFAGYLAAYFRTVAYGQLALTVLFVATLITLNYTVGIENRLFLTGSAGVSVLGFYVFYLFVLVTGWMIQIYAGPRVTPGDSETMGISREARLRLMAILLLAPLYFACKMVHWDLSFLVPGGCNYPWNRYIPIVAQLPAKLLLLGICLTALLAIWRRSDRDVSVGLTKKGFRPGPYLAILALMVPLIALASTQHDFLRAYPRLRNIGFMDSANAMHAVNAMSTMNSANAVNAMSTTLATNAHVHSLWPWRLLYELSYGLDFVTIELFFRGLLVVALSRWLGPRVILPMAAFYCTVHFGKPLGECISSFAGGLALGVLAWRTRSILGGLMVHLGIAWMMEVGGWVGNGFS